MKLFPVFCSDRSGAALAFCVIKKSCAVSEWNPKGYETNTRATPLCVLGGRFCVDFQPPPLVGGGIPRLGVVKLAAGRETQTHTKDCYVNW